MVYAFILHTLLPGTSRVLYHQLYGQEVTDIVGETTEQSVKDVKEIRRKNIQKVASLVHSEYQFRRAVLNRTVEEDIQALNQDDTLPDLEMGICSLPKGEPYPTDKVVVWLGAGNTGFTFICHSTENRLLAESVLKLLIRYMQEHVRVLTQPVEAALKADKMGLVLDQFLPNGTLLFMNHRGVRGLERELEVLMRNMN